MARHISKEILKLYYPVAQSLQEYLTDLIYPNSAAFLTDDEVYLTFLQATMICSASMCSKRINIKLGATDMGKIVEQAQIMLLDANTRNNVLTAGYRLVRQTKAHNLQNVYVNTTLTAFRGQEWDILLGLTGPDVIIHLLTTTSIFLALPNLCFCQLTGEFIVNINIETSHIDLHQPSVSPITCKHPLDEHDINVPRKRIKLDRTPSSHRPFSLFDRHVERNYTSKDVVLVRNRMFYSRPAHIPHSNTTLFGVPSKHILNRLLSNFKPGPSLSAEDPFRNARHLSKYIFPRQYCLPSPFNFIGPGSLTFPDFSDRENDIKNRGRQKTPKRLRDVVPIIEKMLWYHAKCKYRFLCDSACPSRIQQRHTRLDSSVILEMLSETSIHLQSQVPPDSSYVTLDSRRMSSRSIANPRFTEFCCSHKEVLRYIVLVTKAVIPQVMWGSRRNFTIICKHIKSVITSRRFETISLHSILQGFSISDCEWLMPPGDHLRQMRVPVSDAIKRRELLGDFLYWYFDSFVLSLLKTAFYITESAAFRNKILYFRHDDWGHLCAPLLDNLTKDTFEKIPEDEAEEILRQRSLGFSFVRLLPKETGVRPIVNLRRKANVKCSSTYQQSINQILKAAFYILSYEKQSQANLLGMSLFSPDAIYARLKNFKMRLPRDEQGNLPKLYFVKVDVRACFDTINQAKLLEILREIISEDVYTILKYGKVGATAGRPTRKFMKHAVPDDEQPHFLKYATDLAQTLRHTIFVDQVTNSFSLKKDILDLLEEHITDNIVKIGKYYYRQMVGIPQGSILSTLLCNFFYGDLEKRFTRFGDSESVLSRLIDDYLYITTDVSKARGFLDMMNRGHPEYGCFISRDKTLTNFDYDEQIQNVTTSGQKTFPWCGLLIDMKSLSVMVDYTRYAATHLRNTLTVDHTRRPGLNFVRKMMNLAKSRSHVIYTDVELNMERAVHLNIYQNFMLTAMKMYNYLRLWATNNKMKRSFLYDIIHKVILYTYATLKSRGSGRIAKENNARINILKFDIIWLGTYAFWTVFSQKPQKYSMLLKLLKFELDKGSNRKHRRRFHQTTTEGASILTLPW